MNADLPEHLRKICQHAMACHAEGRFAEAANLFASIQQHAPRNADILRLHGLALTRAGDVITALPLLQRARCIAPRDKLTHLHYGIALHASGRFVRAAAMFRRAAILAPADPAPWINLSAALLALGHIPAARAGARRAIRAAPDLAEGHYALGAAELIAGDLAAAQESFARAVQRRRNMAEAWISLVLTLVRQGRVEGRVGVAQQAIERGLAACPGKGALRAAQASFALLSGEHDAAIATWRDVLHHDPNCIAARLNLAEAALLDDGPREALVLLDAPAPSGRDGAHWRAHKALALLQAGDDDAARAELDAVTPPFGDAELLIEWARCNLALRAGHITRADEAAARVAALAATEGAMLFEHRVIAHYNLARFHHQAERTRAAFDHWAAGHALLARLQPFSRADHAVFIETSLTCYDRTRLHHGPRATNADPAPVFIVGLPRSGTTLTEQILAAHPHVYGAGERVALPRLMQRFGPPLSAQLIRNAAAETTAALDQHAQNFLPDLHALAPDAHFVLDKMPGNALLLGFVATLLPGARIILCRRDPRDIALSIFQLRFFGYHPYAHDPADLGWYIGQHERLMRHWLNALPLPVLEVALTDWVDDFHATLSRVLAFLDLPYHPACEHYHEQNRRVRTASAWQVRQPINARGIGRWKLYEAELAPVLRELAAAGLV